MTTTTEYPSATAKARFVRISPTKARRVIDLVRGKSVEEALDILRWAPQAASEPVAKVIASAAANAQNNEGLDPATLVVATVYADEGPTLKRWDGDDLALIQTGERSIDQVVRRHDDFRRKIVHRQPGHVPELRGCGAGQDGLDPHALLGQLMLEGLAEG